MSTFLTRSIKPLFVCENGAYSLASPSDILAAARSAIDCMVQPGDDFTSPGVAGNFFCSKLGGMGYEVFAVAFLNSQLQLIVYREMFHGSISSSLVFPREVAKVALSCNASAVMVAHNHPSFSREPSKADELCTKHLSDALNLLDIRLTDHFVISGNSYFSFAEKRLL